MEFEAINNKYNTEFTNKLLQYRHIFYEIYELCNNKFEKYCESYLFDGITYKYCDLMYEKQELLFRQVKTATSVLEIGSYMGHSLLIMLLSNPKLKITCIDISDTYCLPVITLLNKYFKNAITFIHNDSLDILPIITDKFDFFHIDGRHQMIYLVKEFIRCIELNKNETLRIIFDDYKYLQELEHYIDNKYIIIEKIITNCSYNNIYYELK